MLYCTTKLDFLHCYDESSFAVAHNGELFHRLTADFFAWVLQSVHKARTLAIKGQFNRDTLRSIETRLRAIHDAGTGISDTDLAAAMKIHQRAPAAPAGDSHPDVPSRPGTAPPAVATAEPPPAELAPAVLEALDNRIVTDPPDFDNAIGCHVGIREFVVIHEEGFPVVLLSPEEVAILDRWTRDRTESARQAKRRDELRAKEEKTKKAKAKQKRLDEVAEMEMTTETTTKEED